jgi:hypothetical protein
MRDFGHDRDLSQIEQLLLANREGRIRLRMEFRENPRVPVTHPSRFMVRMIALSIEEGDNDE